MSGGPPPLSWTPSRPCTSDALPSGPGSVAQVRECARLLLAWAKAHRTPVLLAGHVTKEGDVAGPRVLEHMVDVVLSLEGETLTPLRILRSAKNRFGSTNEVALLQMEIGGLAEVADPSLALMSRRQGQLVGSAVVPVLEGTRPLLVEVQALTAPTHSPIPRRVVSGLESTRLVMLVAVLDRRAGASPGRPGCHRERGGRHPGGRSRRWTWRWLWPWPPASGAYP